MHAPRWLRGLAIAAGLLLLADLAGTVLVAVHWRRAADQALAAHYPALAVLHADVPPSLERTRRALDRAVELYREGRTRRILCIGGNRAAAAVRAGEDMRAYLIAQAVPDEHIVVEHQSYDTRTNIKSLGKVLENSRAGPIGIIAYPAHQPRVRYHLRRHAPNVEAVLIVPRPDESLARVAYECWACLHHEIGSWALTLALSEQAFADLLRRSRSGQAP